MWHVPENFTCCILKKLTLVGRQMENYAFFEKLKIFQNICYFIVVVVAVDGDDDDNNCRYSSVVDDDDDEDAKW